MDLTAYFILLGFLCATAFSLQKLAGRLSKTVKDNDARILKDVRKQIRKRTPLNNAFLDGIYDGMNPTRTMKARVGFALRMLRVTVVIAILLTTMGIFIGTIAWVAGQSPDLWLAVAVDCVLYFILAVAGVSLACVLWYAIPTGL